MGPPGGLLALPCSSLVTVFAAVSLSICLLAQAASRDDAFINWSEGSDGQIKTYQPNEDWSPADVDSVVLITEKYGEVRLQLRRDWAPKACEAVAKLAAAASGPHSRECTDCTWYRHEPAPEGWGIGGYFGPPYGLLQGGLRVAGGVEHENPGARPVKVGSAAFISGTTDFFIGTVDHGEWGAAFTVFGQVPAEDMAAIHRLPLEPYHNSTDQQYNFTTRWLDERIPFRVEPRGRLQGLINASS